MHDKHDDATCGAGFVYPSWVLLVGFILLSRCLFLVFSLILSFVCLFVVVFFAMALTIYFQLISLNFTLDISPLFICIRLYEFLTSTNYNGYNTVYNWQKRIKDTSRIIYTIWAFRLHKSSQVTLESKQLSTKLKNSGLTVLKDNAKKKKTDNVIYFWGWNSLCFQQFKVRCIAHL